MKKKDLPLYIVVALTSTILSVLVSNFLITPNKIKVQNAEVVDAISPEFNKPSSNNKYFNKDANNPTKLIQIGSNTDQDPFKAVSN